MHNSLLLEILRKLNKDETKRLEEIIKSPYFNKKSGVIKLFEQMKKFAPYYKNKKLGREIIWKELFPDKEFNYGVMKNLIHGLQKLTEKFIELEVYEKNIYEQKKNYLDALMQKELLSLFEKNLKAAKADVETPPEKDTESFYYKYIFKAKEQNYLSQYRKFKDPHFCKPFDMNESLSSAFFMDFFTQNYNSLLVSRFYNKAYDTGYIKEVLNFFEKSLSRNNHIVRLFYFSLKILINPDDNESFMLLKNDLTKNFKQIDKKTAYNLAMSLVNYCNFHLMKGRLELVKDQFEICRLMVENGIYYGEDNNQIDGSFFVKAAGSAANAFEFEWADKFISDFKSKLHPEKREHNLLMALVGLNIKRKDFESALNYLSKAEVKELIQKINIKRYQMMIYYELGYINELYSFIDASKHFITNDNKSSEAVKKTFFNFVSILLKLLNIKSKPSKAIGKYELEALKEEILSSESPNKIWLLEKISDLQISFHEKL